MKVSSYYPVTIKIDGEDVFFRVKRMNIEEHMDFSARGRETGTPTHARFISRASDGPEQDRNENGEYKIPLAKLAEKKIAELDPKKRAEYETALQEDEQKAKDYLIYVFGSFVRVEKGLLEELPDGTEKSVETGIDVLRLFGARNDVLSEILEAVRLENELSEDQKKIWRSDSVSSPTSNEPSPDPDGHKPETIAPPVETEVSLGAEDV